MAEHVAGTEELVVDGTNGWFTDPHSDAIAERLRTLSADPARLAAMGAAARRSTEAYDWERIVDRYGALYAELAP